jgi:predicted O-methyltransferase YrrM
VDVDRFLRELPVQLEDTSRFERLLEDVPGLATPNTLAVLNVAARCLGGDEWYVEVGTYHGTSVIAAALGNDHDRYAALDNWSFEEASLATLKANLRSHRVDVQILEGDAFETLRANALEGRRVGAYYYDNGHEYEQQLDGMRLIEPYLAAPALVIVDDTDWDRVAQAVADYLDRQPRAREIFRADGRGFEHPEWWDGMRVLRWD